MQYKDYKDLFNGNYIARPLPNEEQNEWDYVMYRISTHMWLLREVCVIRLEDVIGMWFKP